MKVKKSKVFVGVISGLLLMLVVAAVTSQFVLPGKGSWDRANIALGADASASGSSKISVSGTGSVNVNPDVAYISLGVSTRGVDIKQILDENNQAVASVIKAIMDKGVAEKDIRTSDFSMYPEYSYNYDKDSEQIRGYTVSNNITVVIRDIASVGDILGTAANAGANASGGVQFGMLDNSSVYNEALVLAIRNAVGKAETISGELGMKLDNPSLVSENISYYTPYLASAVNFSRDEAVGSVPVQSGKLTITAHVQMEYVLTK